MRRGKGKEKWYEGEKGTDELEVMTHRLGEDYSKQIHSIVEGGRREEEVSRTLASLSKKKHQDWAWELGGTNLRVIQEGSDLLRNNSLLQKV